MRATLVTALAAVATAAVNETVGTFMVTNFSESLTPGDLWYNYHIIMSDPEEMSFHCSFTGKQGNNRPAVCDTEGPEDGPTVQAYWDWKANSFSPFILGDDIAARATFYFSDFPEGSDTIEKVEWKSLE